MSTRRGIRRRESFDEVAELYDKARPGYPQRLVDDLVASTGLDKGRRVLEIGSGTGQLTVSLAERGVSLVAVALAIIETHWGLGHGDDKFFAESQSCYARWDADHNPAFRPPTLEELSEERDDLASSQLFSQIMHSRYLCDREYDAVQYCDLLGTFSNVLAFDERTRSGFLTCIADLIESRFGGRIVRHDLYDLWLARTSTRSGSR